MKEAARNDGGDGDHKVLHLGLLFHGPPEAPLIIPFHLFPINCLVLLEFYFAFFSCLVFTMGDRVFLPSMT